MKTPYHIVFLNPDNLKEDYKLRLRLGKIVMVIVTMLILALVIGFLIPQLMPEKHAVVSQDIDAETVDNLNKEIVNLNDRVQENDEYLNNIQKILNGETPELNEKVIEISDTLTENIPAEMVDIEGDETYHPVEEGNVGNTSVAVQSNKSIPNLNEERAYKFYFIPLRGVITSEYDPLKNHPAIDIQAKQGEPIKAIADGVVLFADWTSSTGYVVVIQHANDVISVYKHNSQVYKKIGDKVKMGEVIAAVGNTGELTTGPHLHFEIWVNGHSEDPRKYLSFK